MSKGFFNNMEQYTQIIKDYPILSAEEFNELLPLAQKGSQKAREKIIFSNTAFLVKEAKKHENKAGSAAVDIEDYIQSGWIALSQCIDRFDVSMGNGFLTYASWYVKKEFGDVDYNSNTITIPHRRVKRNEKPVEQPISLDRRINDGSESYTAADFIPSYYEDIETEYEKKETLEVFDRRFSDVLSEEEAYIMHYITGVSGSEKYNLSELGELVAKRRGSGKPLSKQHIYVIKSRAIKKLRSDKELKSYWLAA